MAKGRTPNGNGYTRLRPDGRWESQVTVIDAHTGMKTRKSIYGKSETEVEKHKREITAQVDKGIFVEPSKLTVGQWLDIWHKEYLGNVKPYTISKYRTQIDYNIKPWLGKVKLSTLSPHMIQSLYNNLQRGIDGRKALSAKSIHCLHGVLHSAMDKALALDYIQRNPTTQCTLPRIEKRELQVIKDADITRFLDAIKGHKYEAVYMVDMFTGLREGEILGLTWDCVDFTNNTLTINKQLQKERKVGGQYFLTTSTKTSKVRTFVVSLHVMNTLRQVRTQQKEWRLQMGSEWNNAMNLVFTNEYGRYLTTVTVYNNLKRIVAGIGLDRVRFHDLRHTFAVLALQNGDNIKTLQQALGHSDISTTLNIYGHVSERMERESADKMDAFIETLRR
ncbi:MAG TPA: site-specific integrase [Candidatus Limiplasma sp.]|nr:site-specific integrase [Candidatus Limiplasma sp.]